MPILPGTDHTNAHFLRIGTRGSPLSRIQAQIVRETLAQGHHVNEDDISIKPITTHEDKTQCQNLSLKDSDGIGPLKKQ